MPRTVSSSGSRNRRRTSGYVFKPTLKYGYCPIVSKRLGSNEFKLIFDERSMESGKEPVCSGRQDHAQT
jgi:hypothetical protein